MLRKVLGIVNVRGPPLRSHACELGRGPSPTTDAPPTCMRARMHTECTMTRTRQKEAGASLQLLKPYSLISAAMCATNAMPPPSSPQATVRVPERAAAPDVTNARPRQPGIDTYQPGNASGASHKAHRIKESCGVPASRRLHADTAVLPPP